MALKNHLFLLEKMIRIDTLISASDTAFSSCSIFRIRLLGIVTFKVCYSVFTCPFLVVVLGALCEWLNGYSWGFNRNCGILFPYELAESRFVNLYLMNNVESFSNSLTILNTIKTFHHDSSPRNSNSGDATFMPF